MRRTKAQLRVAEALVRDPRGRHWGYQLFQVAGVSSGVLYPMLHRFLEQGWLTDGWENPKDIGGRPPRRYYELTDEGLRELGALLAREAQPTSAPQLGWATS